LFFLSICRIKGQRRDRNLKRKKASAGINPQSILSASVHFGAGAFSLSLVLPGFQIANLVQDHQGRCQNNYQRENCFSVSGN
jgi:hypothetical protein